MNKNKLRNEEKVMSNNFNSDDMTGMFDTNDINENKVMSILAYIPVLFLVPLFVAGHSPYAKFHANQGVILTILAVIMAVINAVIGFVIGWIPFIGSFVSGLVSGVFGIVVIALMVVGIVNVASGKAKKLPVIGDLFEIIK